MCNIKIINIKKQKEEPYDLYIGRTNHWLDLEESKWANPFHMKNEGQREEVLRNYKSYILQTSTLYNSLHELEGKTLACYCSPKKCHGDILIELLEEKKVEESIWWW